MAPTEQTELRSWTVSPAKDGRLVIGLADSPRRSPVHGRVRPRETAQKQIEAAELGGDVLFVGLALGHHLAAWWAEAPEGRSATVIELEPELLEIAESDPEVREILEDPRVTVVTDPSEAFARCRCHAQTFEVPGIAEIDDRYTGFGFTSRQLAADRLRAVATGNLDGRQIVISWIGLGFALQGWKVARLLGDESLERFAADAWRERDVPFANDRLRRHLDGLGDRWHVGSTTDVEPNFDLLHGDPSIDDAHLGAYGWVGLEDPRPIRRHPRIERPSVEMPTELEELSEGCATVAFVDVRDLGWVEKLCTERAPGLHGARIPNYLIFRDPALFRALSICDEAKIYRDPSVSVFIGPSALDDFTAWIDGSPLRVLPDRFALFDDGRSGFEATVWQAERVRRRTETRDRRLQSLHEQCIADDAAGRWGSKFELRRILFVTSRFTTVLRHVCRDLQDAAERLGIESQLLIERNDQERLNGDAFLEALTEFQPDAIFMVDAVRPQFAGIPNQIPFVGWVQDRLPRLFDPNLVAEGDRDFTLAMWPEVGRALTEVGHRSVLPFSAATGRVSDRVPQLRDEFVSDLAICTHVSVPESAVVAAAVRQYVQHFGFGFGDPNHYARMRVSLESVGVTVHPDQHREFEHRLYVEYERTIQRLDLARAAIRSGVDVALYGNGWSEYPEFSAIARGPVRPGPDLQDLYFSAGAHLQANLDTNVHARVFEVLQFGGLPICRRHPRDSEPGHLASHLEIGEEVLVFDDENDLRDLVVTRVRDRTARQSIIDRGRERTEREHTFDARLRELERVLQARLASNEVEKERRES